jgi:hypothetical protein
MRRALALETTPPAGLAELMARRRRELEESVARIQESAIGLERREELLRDSRDSLERLLRLGANDLDARESELAQRLGELDAREEAIVAEESELARRRSELGAVELRRASIELRARALDEREADLIEREERIVVRDVGRAPGNGRPELAFVPGAGYGLVELDDSSVEGPGDTVVLAGEEYVVTRVGPSPLPADDRRCAYLVRA